MIFGNLARLFVFLLLFSIAGCASRSVERAADEVHTIAFGSCLRQWQPQPVWAGVSSIEPDVFLFLGDNVYTDTGKYRRKPEPERIGQAYRDLGSTPEFRDFRDRLQQSETTIHAIWDDHDYGKNDAGAEYPYRLESKAFFLKFFGLEETATGGSDEPGIYRSEFADFNGVRVQFLLLDTRSFRSPLSSAEITAACPRVNHDQNTDPDATLLGETQWQWLETELLKPADLRILATSIQFLPTEHCWEKWVNFPLERERLYDLLVNTRANGVIVVSGDRHLAEISMLAAERIGYPLYEITSSGLNSAMGRNSQGRLEQNSLRDMKKNVLVNNFGSIQVTRHGKDIELRLQIRGESGEILQEKVISLDSLRS
jgi:alkaline phosphatase D